MKYERMGSGYLFKIVYVFLQIKRSAVKNASSIKKKPKINKVRKKIMFSLFKIKTIRLVYVCNS